MRKNNNANNNNKDNDVNIIIFASVVRSTLSMCKDNYQQKLQKVAVYIFIYTHTHDDHSKSCKLHSESRATAECFYCVITYHL